MAAPDVYFQEMLKQLAAWSGNNASAATGIGTRQWMIPAARNQWQRDPTDLESIKDAFDRAALNESAQEALHKGRSTAEVAGAKLQCSYLGAMERSFRIRHRSAPRALAQSAKRREAHGDPGGVFIGGVLTHIQNILLES